MLFAISFIVMILGVIPWERFGITIFKETAFLTGEPLGNWWFSELAVWFTLMAIIIGIVYGFNEKEIVSAIIDGAAEMVWCSTYNRYIKRCNHFIMSATKSRCICIK